MITNGNSGTNIHEIAQDIFRINTPVDLPGGVGFSFNQYLIADQEPLVFHSGPRRLFPLVAEAIAGDAQRFDVFARLRHRNFPGGTSLRTPALVLGMAWYRLRDMLG